MLKYCWRKFPDNMKEKHACPCCGYKTFDEQPNGSHNICPVCFWEDDLFQLNNPDYEGGTNWVSLRQAQKNFAVFGACEKDMIKNIRKPTPDEQRDDNWEPLKKK
jgi:isopentenyldiphosphate isomerase